MSIQIREFRSSIFCSWGLSSEADKNFHYNPLPFNHSKMLETSLCQFSVHNVYLILNFLKTWINKSSSVLHIENEKTTSRDLRESEKGEKLSIEKAQKTIENMNGLIAYKVNIG